MDVVVSALGAFVSLGIALLSFQVRRRGKEHGGLLEVVIEGVKTSARIEEKLDAHLIQHQRNDIVVPLPTRKDAA